MILEPLRSRFKVRRENILACVLALSLAFVTTHIESKRRTVLLLPVLRQLELNQRYQLGVLTALAADTQKIVLFRHGIHKEWSSPDLSRPQKKKTEEWAWKHSCRLMDYLMDGTQ